MADASIDLSIIIVTWNARKYMHDCLKSIKEQQMDLSMEIIVVDNASSDGTAALVREEFPDVTLMENECNLGFARGNNVGIRISKGKYLFLVNPDVIVLPGCLQRLASHLAADPSVGVVGPRMLGPDRKVSRSTMRFPTPWNALCRALALDSLFKRSKLFGGYLMSDFQHDTTADVEILNGWFWAANRDAVERVGLLNEELFMYGDDLDWCHRFYQAGYRAVYCADAEAIHYGGGTTARAPAYFYVERQRANIQYWKTYHGGFAVAIYIGTVWLNEAARILGYAGLFLFKKSARTRAAYKIKLSIACLSWLSGLRSNKNAVA
jgi:GT2 family glycosyltransferase